MVPQARAEIGVLNRRWSQEAGPEQFTVAFGETRYRARCGRLTLTLDDDGLEMQTGTRDCEDRVAVKPAELTSPTDVGAQVVRVAARRISTGGLELGLQRLVGGQWESLRQPERAVLTQFSPGSRRFTSTLRLPIASAHVFGELRRGASLTTRDGDFDIEVDGRLFRTRCGVLDLEVLAEHVLVHTSSENCRESVPLLTICPTSDCDVQQNAAYAWESRQIGDSLGQVDITQRDAQTIVNAIYADFLPRNRPPTVSFSREISHGFADHSEIVLGTNVRNLGAVVHELAHVLVRQTRIRAVGHDGSFTAMLLYLWNRYFPIADVDAARDDATRSGIDIAARPPVRARFSEANRAIDELLCNHRSFGITTDVCRAASGAMLGSLDAEVAGLYLGWGADEQLRWGAYSDDEAGVLSSFVARDVAIGHTGREARLSVRCQDDQLQLNIYWQVETDLDWEVLYRLNEGPVQTEQWISGWGTWGDTEYKWTGREDAGDLVSQLAWAAQASGSITAEVHERSNPHQRYTATWQLDGLFDTPVQPNLARCGR